MHNYCGRKLGVVAHEGSNKEKNTHLVPENSGRKSGVVAREGVVLRSFTVYIFTLFDQPSIQFNICHKHISNYVFI